MAHNPTSGTCSRVSARRPSSPLPPASVAFDQISVGPSALESQVAQVFTGPFIQNVLTGLPGPRRRSLLSAEVVLLALLHLVLSPLLQSFLQLIDRMRKGDVPGLRRMSFSNNAFYKRLRELPHTIFLEVFRQVTQALNETRTYRRAWVAKLAPFASGIYAIDDTTLDALQRRSDALQKHKKGATETLAGRLGCLLDLCTGAFADVLYDSDAAANEKTHLLPLIKGLAKGALLVLDLGYFAFPLFDAITQQGHYYVTRMRSKATFEEFERLAVGSYYKDTIIGLGKYRADRASHPSRLVEIFVGGVWYRYVTNVLDPQVLSAHAIFALYGQRWTIEMSFAALKRALGMAFLHPCHQNGFLIQIWCTLSVYQVLQDLRLEIAGKIGWKEDDVSWYNLMQRISQYAEHPANKGPSLRRWLVDEAEDNFLKKRGVRLRRREELPAEVLAASQGPIDALHPEKAIMRTARQGKPNPRTKASEIIHAKLTDGQNGVHDR